MPKDYMASSHNYLRRLSNILTNLSRSIVIFEDILSWVLCAEIDSNYFCKHVDCVAEPIIVSN